MAIAVQLDYQVDLCKPVHLIHMDVPFFVGDQNAHRFHVKLARKGCEIDVSGIQVTGYMVRADKQTVIWDGEADGCDLYLTMPAACYAVPGRFRLLLRVTLGDTIETALWVEGAMIASATDVIVDPGEKFPSLEEMLKRIEALEKGSTGGSGEGGTGGDVENNIPIYVETEAADVLSRVMDAQTSARVFTLAAISDMHFGSGDYPDGVIHAAQAIKYIANRINIDALAVMGDYTDLYIENKYAEGMRDVHSVNALLSDTGVDMLTTVGNHDYHTTNSPQVARAITGMSRGVTWGSRTGGYYYKDFDDYKLRIIALNTNETGGVNSNISCSADQYAWFVSALDMSEKSDADEWQILIMSHHPLDWYEKADDGVYRFAHILDAYNNGTSWAGGGVSCDFTDKNSARIICNVHGHLHNLLVDKICLGELGVSGDTVDVHRMCMPESCFDRPQSYGGRWNASVSYEKTANTADDTAFTILCIDLDNCSIKAINYGAGVDRYLAYHNPTVAPVALNVIPQSVDSDGQPFNGGQGWKSGYRINSSGAEASNGDYCVTGFIPVSSYDYIYLKNMNLFCGTEATEPNTRVALYDSDFTYITGKSVWTTLLTDAQFGGASGEILDDTGKVLGSADIGSGANIARMRVVYGSGDYYIRFSTKLIDATSVVSINVPIE